MVGPVRCPLSRFRRTRAGNWGQSPQPAAFPHRVVVPEGQLPKITEHRRAMTDSGLSLRLAEIASQPNGGAAAADTLRSWLAGAQPVVPLAELTRFAELAPVSLIVDSFRCDLPFGTGGRRGRVGIGPNRINPRTLALTVAGHCEFLRKTAGRDDLMVVVANDTRVFTDINQLHTFMGPDWSLLGTSSRSLALLACQLYAVFGVDTVMTAPLDDSAYMPTPELSFAIRDLRAAGGLNV